MKEKNTQSSIQTIKFFEEFIRKEKVANFIKEFRKILGLPPNGISITDKDIKDFHNDMIPVFYLPERIFPLKGKTMQEIGLSIINTCMAFTTSQGINSKYIPIMLRMHLIFNTTVPLPPEMFDGVDDLLKLEHVPSELSWYSNDDHYLLKRMYEHFDNIAKKYPIALYINPEASQNQIKDFISKNWSYIKSHRNTKGITLGKIRQKKQQDRNDFIYKNRNMSLATIRKKLVKEYKNKAYLDDGHISKIIQIEKKKRS